jgi:hypothetical protein
MFPRGRLDIYLNDHLAGSTLGVEPSRRSASENRGSQYAAFLERLCREILEDRRTLEAVMRALDVDRSPAKPAGAWLLEKLSRLKLNGQVRGYSPLTRLDFAALVARADEQLAGLRDQRLAAAPQALVNRAASPTNR